MSYIKTIYTIFKKEMLSYFNSPIAYIFIAIFLIISNWLFFNSFFIIGQANMRNYFVLLPWIFLFLIPAITMRTWSEEKKSGTIEFLLTLPITNLQAVLGKFLALICFLISVLFLGITIPITVAYLGNLDLGPVIGGYLGAILMGSAYISIGMWTSSLTKNQIISFITALALSFILFIIGANFVIASAPHFIQPTMKFLGIGSHFYNIAKGVIDSKDIIYYFSIIFLFLWLNIKTIEKRT